MPSISIENYMEHVQGPDFPTGAGIHGVDGIYDMYLLIQYYIIQYSNTVRN